MRGYAVIDCETTGLDQKHRVLEIAVLLYDTDFNLTGSYETVLNPKKDLGLVSLHGINGLIASEAPIFPQIATSLAHLLNDRVIIGHNVKFDIGFVCREFSKVDSWFMWRGACIDTVWLARNTNIQVDNYKLETLCEHFGITNENAHTAMGDARATAELFQKLLAIHGPKMLTLAERALEIPSDETDDFSEWMPRHEIEKKLSIPYDYFSYLNTLRDGEEDLNLSDEKITAYLSGLHRSLINGSFSHRERTAMEETVALLNLSKLEVINLNEEYIYLLICQNLTMNEGRWKPTEDDCLRAAIDFTEIKESRVRELARETLANPELINTGYETLKSLYSLSPNDKFVLDGEDFINGRDYWTRQLPIMGYAVKDKTTRTQTKAVICNDPYNLSQNIDLARQFNIQVLTEDTLARLIKQFAF